MPAFGDVDRSYGARICTLNLPGELASHGSPASDLARLCMLAAAGRRDGLVRLECSWRQPEIPAGALLNRHLGGKVIFGIG